MAVYTEVSDGELETFLAAYDIGRVVACKGIAEGVENSNYLLQTDRGLYILTLYEKRVAKADLPFFVGLMDHLAAKGLACPTPIRARDGQVLHELARRPAAIISFLRGMWPKRILVTHCAQVGEALARLHLAGADFPMHRANALTLAGWKKLFEDSRARADEVQKGLAEELGRELDDLAAHWPRGLPEGVIHADLFPDNVFFLDDKLSGMIDFYFACNDAFAYDLGICLNAWCFERDDSFNATKARALVRGYAQTRPITPAEVEVLPILARGSALRFLLTRLYDWLHHPAGAFVQPKDPLEYLKKLRFHRTVTSASAYGL
ncbi:MAG: homoserine kinase [Alphaproteobacteria bacterium]|nr:homoserine kinase [Alphaproteobacteria bacterium]